MKPEMTPGWPQPRLQIKRWPKISIVTPSFNQGQFLEATIQSILSQNYPNLEYIIMDGGSTDGSVEIIKKYERHLYYWVSAPDGGMYEAISRGMSIATGEIMAWLNSDDLYLPWALHLVASIMEELPEVEWMSTLQPAGWDEEGLCTGIGRIAGFSRESFLRGRYLPSARHHMLGWIQQESTFWRRSLWNKVDTSRFARFSLAGDFFLWSQFYRYADLYGVPLALGGFRRQGSQKTQRYYQEYLAECELCLQDARDVVNWKRNLQQDCALRLHLNRIPKLKRLAAERLGHTGKRISRQWSPSEGGRWEIEAYPFL
jgi:glycosyltransferase involved in cell wall biosynthesis